MTCSLDIIVRINKFSLQAFYSLATEDMSDWSCYSWTYVHLLAVGSCSWMTFATISLSHFFRDFVPSTYVTIALLWSWTVTILFILPSVVTKESLINVETCSVRPTIENFPMILFLSTMVFFLPALILCPIMLKMSSLGGQKSFYRPVKLDDFYHVRPEKGHFRPVMLTLVMVKIICWTPFFFSLLLVPFLEISHTLGMFFLWIGYSESFLAPLLICFTVEHSYNCFKTTLGWSTNIWCCHSS